MYSHYDHYSAKLKEYGIEFIPYLALVHNPSDDQLNRILTEQNTFLIKDNAGVGEGIVLKNYIYTNKYGRQCFAKIVRSEFKDLHRKEMGGFVLSGDKLVEELVAMKYCTPAFVEKTYEKIKNKYGSWSSKYIPELLNTCFHDLVAEETWNILKEHKNPTINFKKLQHFIYAIVKDVKKEVF